MHGAEERHAELRDGNRTLLRRSSHDESSSFAQRFVVDVQYVMDEILKHEDLDGNLQITIDDAGSKASVSHLPYTTIFADFTSP